jgi:hypothetical protein
VVFAVVVVVVEAVREVASEAAEADLEVARERRSPAFFEDRAVQAFDVAVGLRAPGTIWLCRVGGQQGREFAAAELGAVVGQGAFKLPAGLLQFGGDAVRERGRLRAAGTLRSRRDQFSPDVA